MADRKITDLTALAAGSQATGDLLTIVDVSEGAAADKNKKITVESLFKGIPSNVGIGTSSPSALLHLSADSSASLLVKNEVSSGPSVPQLQLQNDSGHNFSIKVDRSGTGGFTTIDFNAANTNSNHLSFVNDTSEVMRLDGSGRVGIGTSSPTGLLHVNGSTFSRFLNTTAPTLDNNTHAGEALFLRSGGSSGSGNVQAVLALGKADSSSLRTGAAIGSIQTDSDGDKIGLSFYTSPSSSSSQTLSEKLRITHDGNVGIGSTAPGHTLEVKGSFPDFAIVDSDTTNDKFRILHNGGGTQLMVDPNNVGPNASYFLVSVDGTERMRIDSSGRLLVGTTSADSNTRLHVSAAENTSDPMATDASIVIANTQNAGNNEAAALKFNLGNTNTASISAHYDSFSAGVNSSLRFYTQYQSGFNSPAERMRISNTGVLSQSTNTSDSQFYGNINVNVFHSDNDNNANMIVEHSGGNPYGLVIEFTDNNPDNNTNYFLKCTDSSTNRLFIYSDGDIDNHDNSYGAISDEKLKQDIIDAGSQWDDLKDLRVRKFKFKSDVAAYGDEAKTLIGVVAQEAELVSPGLVKESPDVDEDGNDLGTTTKSVRYSVLYMKAVKALQEAQTRIETLESQHADLLARVTALEAG